MKPTASLDPDILLREVVPAVRRAIFQVFLRNCFHFNPRLTFYNNTSGAQSNRVFTHAIKPEIITKNHEWENKEATCQTAIYERKSAQSINHCRI